jgi:hypothetical protein
MLFLTVDVFKRRSWKWFIQNVSRALILLFGLVDKLQTLEPL